MSQPQAEATSERPAGAQERAKSISTEALGIPNGAWTSAREQNNNSLKSALPSTRELDSQGQIAPGRHLEHCWGRISGGKQLVHSQLGAQMAQDSDQRVAVGWNGLPRGSQDGCDTLQVANNSASRGQLRAFLSY